MDDCERLFIVAKQLNKYKFYFYENTKCDLLSVKRAYVSSSLGMIKYEVDVSMIGSERMYYFKF